MEKSVLSKQGISNILMIDDNVIELSVCKSLLQETFKCDIETRNSVSGALDYLSKIKSPNNAPDIIICDVNLPFMDGHDFVKAYSELPSFLKERSELYMISGSYNDHDVDQFKKDKLVKRFLQKPLNTAELFLN